MSWVKIFSVALLLAFVVVVCLTFDVWAAAFLGLLFAVSLNRPAEWIRSKWHMPAWTATSLALLMVLAVVTGLGFVIGPPLVGQADKLAMELPKAVEQSLDWLDERKWGRRVVQQVESIVGLSTSQNTSEGDANSGLEQQSPSHTTDVAQQQYDDDDPSGDGNDNGGDTENVRSVILPIFQTLTTMLSVTASTLMLVLVSFVITLYIALNPDVYHRGILWLIPAKHETVAKLTMTRISVTLRWWMIGRLASMLVVGLLTSLGMWLVGMPAPLALGALAGVLSFVPNIGPIVAALPGLLLAVPEGPWMLFSALAVYIAAQLIESNLITPMVDQYTVATPAAVLILAQVIMGVLAGAWGVVIATPLLVVVMVLTQQLYVREFIKKEIHVIGSPEEESTDPPANSPPKNHPPSSAPNP